VTLVLGENDGINETAYREYSPIYVSATMNMTYTVAYALTTAMIVHTALWHGPRIWRGIRNKQYEVPDIHAKLMSVYKTVPKWWYGGVFVVLFALAIVCVQVFDTNLPVYGLIIAMLLPAVYFLPAAFLYASTAQIMTLNLISQLVPGFVVPGRPIAVMVSPCFELRRIADVSTDVESLHTSDPLARSGLCARHEGRTLHENPSERNVLRPIFRHDSELPHSSGD
jgi:hypothetical protein